MPADSPPPPPWTVGATRRDALWRGFREAPSIPVLVVVATFLGFGALCRELGFGPGHAIFVAVSVNALPGQVVLVDQLAHGATLGAAAFAVALTAIRLLPMTVYLMPFLRDRTTPRWALYLLSHHVAITAWLEALRRLPPLPAELRVPYFAAFGTTVVAANMISTAVGYQIAGSVPLPVAAGLIFLSPVYFLLSMIAAVRTRADMAAIAAGAVLGPPMFLFAPGIDLLLTGLAGGTAAYLLHRLARRRP